MDAAGKMFEQYVTTIDVTTTGARIGGVKHELHRGCVIGIERRGSRARFRVTWVGNTGNRSQGEIGVRLVESGKLIWGRVIPHVFGDPFVELTPQENHSSSIATPPKDKNPTKRNS
jgi:hypothetical protein